MTVDADWARDRLEEYWQLARASCMVRHWSVTQGTVSQSSAESEVRAITKGCVEALYVKHLLEHQTARTLKKLKFGRTASSAEAIMQRLGSGSSVKHLEVQTMWVQQYNKLGLFSMNKLSTVETVAGLLTKQVRELPIFVMETTKNSSMMFTALL